MTRLLGSPACWANGACSPATGVGFMVPNGLISRSYYGRGYKYPRHGWFVEQLPKAATGKLLKREIKAPADIAATG